MNSEIIYGPPPGCCHAACASGGILLQKFVWLPVQSLGNPNQTGQRKVVFATLDTTDKCPVHVSPFGERLLRQGHLFTIRTHMFSEALAILIVHFAQFWRKERTRNIDVNSIAYNTSQESESPAQSHLFPEFHWKFLDAAGKHTADFLKFRMNGWIQCGRNGRDGFQWIFSAHPHNLR